MGIGANVEFNFEWDPRKAAQNQQKHGVAFEQAATVFADPRALTIYDDEHSSEEDRWITMGLSAAGLLLVVHHTYDAEGKNISGIRIFSSRKATKNEETQYGE